MTIYHCFGLKNTPFFLKTRISRIRVLPRIYPPIFAQFGTYMVPYTVMSWGTGVAGRQPPAAVRASSTEPTDFEKNYFPKTETHFIFPHNAFSLA